MLVRSTHIQMAMCACHVVQLEDMQSRAAASVDDITRRATRRKEHNEETSESESEAEAHPRNPTKRQMHGVPSKVFAPRARHSFHCCQQPRRNDRFVIVAEAR